MRENSFQSLKTNKNKTVVGILAHVDSGKTTLAESILYEYGKIKNPGRVDHGDAFLDNFDLEKKRGITIFSKMARLSKDEREFILLDTPGHVDFSTEMERALQVMDCAILLISGPDGVQGHVSTLWKLLESYEIPTFIFVNKMDQPGTDSEAILKELREKLSESIVPFSDLNEAFYDDLAMCHEDLMEEFLETGRIDEDLIKNAVDERIVFPLYFGSALKITGVTELLEGIDTWTDPPEYGEEFGARVYKVTRDESGNRLTYLKVLGGSLKVKSYINNYKTALSDEAKWEEKADQIRLYDGEKYTAVSEVFPGEICAVTGLSKTVAGEGLGVVDFNTESFLSPVLSYKLNYPEDKNPSEVLKNLRILEEEDPALSVMWSEATSDIHIRVMGQVQIEVLKSLMASRFDTEVSFDTGSIVYKETLTENSLGIGHYEPLRHYAEVQVLLEPGERGSGIEFASVVSEDDLDL
ncbi:MAG: GTP-binding protein, partial [Lachnospiraceae bacterium]|nr:GTP-binding protein [Lachnospiraceae bacterium]